MQLEHLEVLALDDTGIGDSCVELISHKNGLHSINISKNPNVSDRCLPYLMRCSSLKGLEVAETSISPRGAAMILSSMPLQFVSLKGLHITNDDVPAQICKTYQLIDLSNNSISDLALVKLNDLPLLFYVDVRGDSQVTPGGAKAFCNLHKHKMYILQDDYGFNDMDSEWYYEPAFYQATALHPEGIRNLVAKWQLDQFDSSNDPLGRVGKDAR